MAISPIEINADLFRELGKGSEEALKLIYTRCASQLMDYSFGIIADKDLAREVVMDTLHALWENRKAISKMDKPIGWLVKTTYHKSLNKLRSEKRRKVDPIEDDLVLADADTRIHHLELNEFISHIDYAINQLPEQQQKMVRLARDHGLNRKEIAAYCKLSESTVKNHITRAYKKLRQILGNNLGID